MICYNTEPQPYSGKPFQYESYQANKHYQTHYYNYLVLDFISKSTNDRAERAQALRELDICERKMLFCRRHPNFDSKLAEQHVLELKRQFNR
jgi:hypothetical protein